MGTLVLLRHGQSVWNAENLFTGWVDVPLSETGEQEARRGGELLREAGLLPDVVHTSLLRRAISTANLALDACDRHWIPVRRDWRLNERHYGALQGKDKKQTLEEFGEEQFMIWRRSYDVPPPPIEPGSEFAQDGDPRYAPGEVPRTECLADVVKRFLPYWESAVVPDLRAGKVVLLAAHGNSLRALVKHLDGISDEDIVGLNIPTGIPLRYELDDELRPTVPGRRVPRPRRGGRSRGRGGCAGPLTSAAAPLRRAGSVRSLGEPGMNGREISPFCDVRHVTTGVSSWPHRWSACLPCARERAALRGDRGRCARTRPRARAPVGAPAGRSPSRKRSNRRPARRWPTCCSGCSARPTQGWRCSTAAATSCCTTRAPPSSAWCVAAVPDARAATAASRCCTPAPTVDVDLSPLDHRGRQPAAVLAQVRPLGDGYTMVEAADTSERVRLEATRRDFVANVSHELKTPVGAVGLLAEAVLDAADDPAEVRRFGTKILNESTRLGNLVTELIALSRLTGAERLPELQVVDVDEVVQRGAGPLPALRGVGRHRDHRRPADRARGRRRPDVAGHRPVQPGRERDRVLARPRRRCRCPAGAVGSWVEIAVTDRGIGIAPEHQKRVFERFFRVDPARSRATGGTGLGLAIVKHVLANHGGEVRLWSSPGTGSTFTMRLPVHVEPGTESAEPVPDTASDHSPAAPTEPVRRCARPRRVTVRRSMTRVLIVEDEESFADPLAFLLRKEGFTTAVAATGQDALEEFDRNGADIVLLDLMLPGMSGTDVCKALRTRSAVPVIMVTARDSEIDKVVGLELGADDYVTKPYSARELIARVRAVLRRGGEGGAEADRPARRARGRVPSGWTSSGTSCR